MDYVEVGDWYKKKNEISEGDWKVSLKFENIIKNDFFFCQRNCIQNTCNGVSLNLKINFRYFANNSISILLS